VSKGSPHSISERRVPGLTPVLSSQPASDVSHKPGGRLPLLSARPAVTPASLKRAIISYQGFLVRPLLREPRPQVHYKNQPDATAQRETQKSTSVKSLTKIE